MAGLITGGMLAAAAPAYGETQVWLFRSSGAPSLFAGAVNSHAVTVKRQFPLSSRSLDSWSVVPVPGHAIIDPVYKFRNRATGLCMVEASTGEILVANLSGCSGRSSSWRFYSAGGVGPLRATPPPEGVDSSPYQIRNDFNQRCLTVSYSRYEIGTQLRLFTCARIPSRLWIARVFPAPA